MILLDMAVDHAGIFGRFDDRLHRDHAGAKLLEGVVWQPPELGHAVSLLQILQVKLGSSKARVASNISIDLLLAADSYFFTNVAIRIG